MKPERYKPIKKEKPKRKGKISRSRARKPITSPQLREAYSTKIEWVRKLIPKLKEEAEAPEEKEELR